VIAVIVVTSFILGTYLPSMQYAPGGFKDQYSSKYIIILFIPIVIILLYGISFILRKVMKEPQMWISDLVGLIQFWTITFLGIVQIFTLIKNMSFIR